MEERVRIPWEDWNLVKLLGKGGFGEVWEIERVKHGITEKAAMKVISIPQGDDEIECLQIEGYTEESITQRFSGFVDDVVREYGMMVQMKGNSNIVYCDDYTSIQHDDGFGWDIYIKMELLTPMMKALKLVSAEPQIIQFAQDICRALVVCQKRKVIHRDIKPQNIFVSEDGVFKLGDFGIARTAERTTRATVGKGTYQFMAPEVKNDLPYGATADIYSLGLVLHWLLNERRSPFLPLPPEAPKHGDEERAKQRRFSGEQIPAPKNGSKELQEIVLKACAFDPSQRYQSAAEMLADLQKLQGGFVPVYIPETDDAEAISNADAERTVGPVFGKKDPNTELDVERTVGPQFDKVEQAGQLDIEKTVGPVFAGTPTTTDAVPVDNDTTVGPSFLNKSAFQKESAEVATHAAVDRIEDNSKKRKHHIIGMCMLLFVILCAAVILFWPWYGEWSEWSAVVPEPMDGRKVESTEQYRYREKELVESEEDSLEGGILVSQREDLSDFSEWSEWQADPVQADNNCKVESQIQYRSRKMTTTETWSEWSSWSNWSTTSANESESCEVKTRTVYAYNVYRYHCNNCGKVFGTLNINMVVHATQDGMPDEAVANLSSVLIHGVPEGMSLTQILNNAGYSYQNNVVYGIDAKLIVDTSSNPYKLDADGSVWFTSSAEPSKTEPQYSTRTRKLVETESWSDWSDYTSEQLHADQNTEVEQRVAYRFCTREIITIYEFVRWSEWSEWTDVPQSISAEQEQEQEQRIVYRYADRCSFWEILLKKN